MCVSINTVNSKMNTIYIMFLFVYLTCRLKNVFGLHICPTEAEFKVMFISMSMYLGFLDY